MKTLKSLFFLVLQIIATPFAIAAEYLLVKSGAIAFAVDPEIWTNYIIGSLFKNNNFFNYAFNADEYVLRGKVVHIPQAGATSGTARNRSSLPATVTKRSDTDITYAIDEFTTDPRVIEDIAKILTYDKMESAIGEDMATLRELVADWLLYAWLKDIPATQILRTTGGNVAAHLADATGNRKSLLAADLKAARKLMNKNNIPVEDRYALIDSDMYDQLTTDVNFTSNRDAIRELNLPEGTIGKLYGFWLMERSAVAVATNASTPVIKEPGAAGASTDNGVVLCWQKNAVERAMGDIKLFQTNDDPTYYGSLFSLLVNMGGRRRRTDSKGVVAIIQAAA